ncbi:MAG: hypothetical protein VB877_11060, partial [Pirellulaceae bacterium]
MLREADSSREKPPELPRFGLSLVAISSHWRSQWSRYLEVGTPWPGVRTASNPATTGNDMQVEFSKLANGITTETA